MKKELYLFLLLGLLFSLSTLRASAQTNSYISVRGSDVNNGVVVVDVLRETKPYHLQCNQGAPGCTNLKAGKYLMVELPPNYGIYDCKDVEVYPESVADPNKEANKKLGEYCLLEGKQ